MKKISSGIKCCKCYICQYINSNFYFIDDDHIYYADCDHIRECDDCVSHKMSIELKTLKYI